MIQKAFLNHQKNTLITIILQKNTLQNTIEKTILDHAHIGLRLKSRGTLIREKWYEQFLPTVHPEQDVFKLLVPSKNTDFIMSKLIETFQLYKSSSGAIFETPCKQLILSDKNSKPTPKTTRSRSKFKVSLQKDLIQIICITQKEKSDHLTKIAVNLGIPSPMVLHGQGKGVRDRLGILRIAINPEKEIMSVLVNKENAQFTFDTLSTEGNFQLPGEGFIYMVPINKGLINIKSIVMNKKQPASISQIIKAIDELKGNTDWRDNYLTSVGNTPQTQNHYLEGLVRLTCISDVGASNKLVSKALEVGAPGATMVIGTQLGNDRQLGNTSIQLSTEKELIEMTVSVNKVNTIIATLQDVEKTRRVITPYFLYTYDS
ncbi:hypothetical protein DID77_02705 [Candidatus Marinamargulisbacteria bacterium SCGC AG-439-L15]|nr:hypothetical protein DID77_02705 [Candidatus Marinamargulisbacteria bacterium SCGC AG-439-L15]